MRSKKAVWLLDITVKGQLESQVLDTSQTCQDKIIDAQGTAAVSWWGNEEILYQEKHWCEA